MLKETYKPKRLCRCLKHAVLILLFLCALCALCGKKIVLFLSYNIIKSSFINDGEEGVHQYQDLIKIFNDCFFERYNTLLVKGADEPIYLPADENRPHNELYFAHGFFASALHESSHWLIAGESRRKLVDFGYWYAPDGRSAEQQELFQSVEVKPQAIEWILSVAAGYRFRVSVDNLNGSESKTDEFKNAVHRQVKTYCEQGLSTRAESFRQGLSRFYGTPFHLNSEDFDMKSL